MKTKYSLSVVVNGHVNCFLVELTPAEYSNLFFDLSRNPAVTSFDLTNITFFKVIDFVGALESVDRVITYHT